MKKKRTKISLVAKLRNYFITGIFVLIPIGITLYLTLFLIKVSSARNFLVNIMQLHYLLSNKFHFIDEFIPARMAEFGRRAWFRTMCPQGRAGSTPVSSTLFVIQN